MLLALFFKHWCLCKKPCSVLSCPVSIPSPTSNETSFYKTVFCLKQWDLFPRDCEMSGAGVLSFFH